MIGYVGALAPLVIHSAATSLPEPTTATDGVSLDELAVYRVVQDTAVRVRTLPATVTIYGTSPGAAATVSAPELRVFRDGVWFQPLAPLNDGNDIVGKFMQRIGVAGDWERIAIYSPGPIVEAMTFEVVGEVQF